MNVKIYCLRSSLTVIISGFIIIILSQIGYSQSAVVSNEEPFLPPSQEEFSESSDLLAPWRETGCYRGNPLHKEPNCRIITSSEFLKADALSLYDEKGALWYHFSLSLKKDNYFLKNRKPGFAPLAPELREIRDYEPLFPPDFVILRMVAESKHWYEVEVNEKTKETKFVLKSDPMWAKTNWSYWLYFNINLKINGNKVKLLDNPDGKVLESSANITFDLLTFVKAEGDWAFVEGYDNNKKYFGWIRWRKDRDFLVGCIFNDNKVPNL